MGWGLLGAAALGGAASLFGQKSANDSNAAQAQRQMDFQERMSSTAYQRAMADMGKAGLNPMLAYAQGGASSPQGAQANIKNVAEGANQATQTAVSSALESKRLKQQNNQINSQIGLNVAVQQKNKQDALLGAANTRTANENAKRAEMENKLMAERLPREVRMAKWDNSTLATVSDYASKKVNNWIGGAGSAIGGAVLGANLKRRAKGLPTKQSMRLKSKNTDRIMKHKSNAKKDFMSGKYKRK